MKAQCNLRRREFLAAAGAVASAPYLLPSGVLAAQGKKGANERINVGHIGMGGRASSLYRELNGLRDKGECQSVAVCDIDESRLARAAKTSPGSAVYRDYRYILQRKDIDAVVIGTPDHWHGVHFVHSAESGKHIYCEKPACCTLEESKAMIDAAKKAGIASQIGSQGRSQPEAYSMHRYLANKAIGDVDYVECFHYPSPEDRSNTPNSDPPPELDWDLWLGPLPWRPFNKRYLHGVFRWLLESGGGQIRDRGAHVMSCAMYWMGADGTGPVSVEATGTAPTQGLWDSAITMNVTYTFKNPDWKMTWTQMSNDDVKRKYPPETRVGGEPGGRISRPGYGAVYHGSDGKCIHWGGDGGTWAEKKVRDWEIPAGGKDVYRSPGHMEDWFVGIRTGKKCIMDIEWGAGTANLCVLANMSYILGRKLNWDHEKWTIVGDEEAQRMFSRPQRYPYVL
ncbi:MAG: Gfo/Idh/MocA family oxidoreductase [Candidatus Nealsonbacteria bacterium]|nr:Gfo/Idh/MocA family oxidoreductase [Candidatus Nealsonbacteria bacterium]